MKVSMLARAAALAMVVLGIAPAFAQDGRVYAIATTPQGSQFYSIAAAITKLASDKLNIQARVQPMAGPQAFIPLLDRGEVDFALIAADDAETSYRGTETYEGKPNTQLRLIAVMFPLPVAIAVVADSPARRIADLKGLRLPTGYAIQAIVRKAQNAILATGGLTMDDVRGVPVVNVFQATEMLSQGRLDAAATSPTLAQTQQAHAALQSRGGIRFLSIETAPAAIAAMQKIITSRPQVLLPGRNFVGIFEPTTVLTYSAFLAAHLSVATELVHDIARLLHENHDALRATVPALAGFDPKRMNEPLVVPYHPGAERFYRGVDQWPPKG